MNPYIGHESQLSGFYRFTYTEGALRGLDAVEVYNETGLRFTILLGRGMDIGYASYKGQSLAQISKCGFSSAVYFQNGGKEWQHAFGAGLVTTCGLSNVGPGSEENGEIYGTHGRYSSLSAEQVSLSRSAAEGDEVLEVSGVIRQAEIFGENFEVYRTIRTYSRQNKIELTDTIINQAFEPMPLMLMYHCNFGYPLLNENAVLKFDAQVSTPRDAAAQAGFAEMKTIQPPRSGFAEQVYFHSGVQSAELCSHDFGVRLSWSQEALPCMTQWSMFGCGDYVLGLEPGNCFPVGRSEFLQSDSAEYLAAGESKTTALLFEII
ncbi:aldose 1-epimerase family protein [Hydrogenoanaerobacterium sp.]|uniref:aldose 1-epimerase family protein n=1 Tax=Hydrogenoanaerobacterium sp. TaxID=2953763 RepID=UPI00289DAF3A|nr:aldose 1-epimerase family protein [Hydrogenoanaerobacterium sp.]